MEADKKSKCSDCLLGHGVRDVTVDDLVLKSGQDLPKKIQPAGNLEHFHISLSRCKGAIDEDSLPNLKDDITIFEFKQCTLDPFILPEMPKFEEIRIDSCKFPPITEVTFSNVTNLKTVNVKRSPETKMESGCFKDLSQLKNITIQDQIINNFDREWLEGLAGLKNLTLDHNDIEQIDEDVFENCKELTILNINEPTLLKFEPDTFKPLTKLKHLSLLRSPLQKFSLESLSEQKNLTSISLPTKFLLSVGVDALKGQLPNLEFIQIDEKHEDLDDMKKLKERAKELKIRVASK